MWKNNEVGRGRWEGGYVNIHLYFVEKFDYHESFSYIKLPSNKKKKLTVN